jgi:predicted nuclease of predicted toxin-antitoxin system
MILADENIPDVVVARLRADGLEVLHVAEVAPSIPDTEVLALALQHDALILTADKDFGELVVGESRPSKGVLLVRLAGVPVARRAEMVSVLFRDCMHDLLGAFSVLSANGRVRIRHFQND